MRVILLALHLASSAVPAVEQPAVLCLDATCSPRESADLRVERADVARRFIWISGDGARVVTGIVPPGQTMLSLESAPAAHSLRVRFSAGAVPVTFELSSPGASWKWTASPPRRAVIIQHPNATSLRIAAPEHRLVEQPLSAAAKDLGTIDLHRLPLLTGAVVDAKTSAAVAGAEISFPAGDVFARTDEAGKFRIVVEDAWPAAILVASPRHAPKIVTVPKTVTDTELPRIALSEGGSIDAVIEGMTGTEETRWQLRAIVAEFKDELRREGRLTKGQTRLMIEGVEAGEYRLIVRGEGPLQQFSTELRVREGERSQVRLAIQPVTLEIETRLDENALPSADVEIAHETGRWRGRVTTDENGIAETELWQPGLLEAIVAKPPLVNAWRASETIEREDGPARWILRAEDRKVRGRVLDSEGAQPIDSAVVLLEMRAPDGQILFVRTVAGKDGSFEMGGLVAGMHTLEVVKPGYLPKQKWSFALGATEKLHEKDLFLVPYAAHRKLAVVSSRGLPIAGAGIFFASRTGVREIGATDASGEAMLPLATRDETGVVFVVPRSGSLAFARVTRAEDADDAILIRVPDAVASLEVRTETTSGQPLSNIAVMMQWNGMLIPHQVLGGMNQMQGLPLATNTAGRLVYPHLPPGQYELWPVASRDDFRRLYFGTLPPPAAALTLVQGAHSVVLKFDAK